MLQRSIQARIQSIAPDELLVGAFLHDLTVLEDQGAVRLFHR
jgi:hypothetical protein